MKPDKKNLDRLHRTTLLLILIMGYTGLVLIMPVMLCHLLGQEAWKVVWVENVFDPLTIPWLILVAITAAFAGFYRYGYLYKNYPPFLEYGKRLEEKRKAQQAVS